MRERDQARGSASERGYDSRWQKARAGYLRKHPLCVRCGEPATVVDHIVPHRGDRRLFWDSAGNWAASCQRCHNEKTAAEDGRWGAYANHPWTMRRATIPTTVVCGPPGAGKSTLVARLRAPTDLVLDLEEFKAQVSGLPLYHGRHVELVRDALRLRNWRLLELCEPDVGTRRGWSAAWVIAWEQRAADRRWWRETVGARVVLVMPSPDACLAHVRNDARRPPKNRAEAEACVRTWFSEYTADPDDTVLTDSLAPWPI